MLKISKLYENIKSEKINFKKSGDLYNLKVNGVKVRKNLENIFIYGENLLILVSKGKFGAVQYDDSLNEIQSLPCVYDTLDEYWHNLVFSKKNEVVYYNATSKDWILLLDIYVDNHFIYGEDEETYRKMNNLLKKYPNSSIETKKKEEIFGSMCLQRKNNRRKE